MHTAVRWVMAVLAMAMPTGALFAQVSLNASVMSDYRLRGYTLSHGHPAASIGVGYDDVSGLFVDGSAIAFLAPEDGPQWMGGIVALGYAKRLGATLSVDAGLTRAQFSAASSLGRAGGYTEIFGGVSKGGLSARLAYSPDYFRPGASTLYGSAEAVARRENWRVFGHVGVLARLNAGTASPIPPAQYDWLAGVGRIFGPINLELTLSGGGPRPDYYDARPHSMTAVVGKAQFAF